MNKIYCFVKLFQSESHREDFLSGNLYMNTLKFFKGYEEQEESNVGDKHEAPMAWLQPGQFIMKLDGVELPEEDGAGPMLIQNNAHDRLNVLCLYSIHDCDIPNMKQDGFESFVEKQMLSDQAEKLGKFSVVITNTCQFSAKVLDGIRRLNVDGWAGLVDYYDSETFHGIFDKSRAAFNKRDSYEHQREYRFAIDRENDEDKPFTLEVGSLRDICTPMPTSAVNEALRASLHHLRQKGIFELE